MSNKRIFSKEFKLKAVKLYLEGKNGGCKILSRELGVNDHRLLLRWIEKYNMYGEQGLENMTGKAKGPQKGRPRTVNVTIEDENLRLKAENEYLRKLLELNKDNIKKKTIYITIFELHNKYPLRVLLEASGIKKSSYYKWLKKQSFKSSKDNEDDLILDCIKHLYEKHKGRYGVDRMTHALINDYGMYINHKRVYRLMKNNGFLAVIKAKKIYVKPGEVHPKRNILKRNFDTSCPFDKLVTDITEMKKCGNKIYLSSIKDLHTGMIESFEISKHPSLALAIATIGKISGKAIPEGTYLHSDQGSLYNHPQFQKRLEVDNFIQSMSRKGTPIDNSPMESFFGTFKSELLYNPLIKILDVNTLIAESITFIDYYNNERIQKKLGYQTPSQFKVNELLRLKEEESAL